VPESRQARSFRWNPLNREWQPGGAGVEAWASQVSFISQHAAFGKRRAVCDHPGGRVWFYHTIT